MGVRSHAPSDIVVGMVVNGEVKASPYNILNRHEIVNEQIGGVNVAVSYCPLCNTIVVFYQGNTTFSVSGKLYQSCLAMYDWATESGAARVASEGAFFSRFLVYLSFALRAINFLLYPGHVFAVYSFCWPRMGIR